MRVGKSCARFSKTACRALASYSDRGKDTDDLPSGNGVSTSESPCCSKRSNSKPAGVPSWVYLLALKICPPSGPEYRASNCRLPMLPRQVPSSHPRSEMVGAEAGSRGSGEEKSDVNSTTGRIEARI